MPTPLSPLSSLPGLTLIGERLNTHRPDFEIIVQERDVKALHREIRRQQQSGATHLDFNASALVTAAGTEEHSISKATHTEQQNLIWMLENALTVLDENVGIVLDSPSPDVLVEAANITNIRTRTGLILNGMTADFTHIQKLLPLLNSATNTKRGVVLILSSQHQSPRSTEERLTLAEQLCDILKKARVDESQIYIDPQVLPLGHDPVQARSVLETCREIRQRWPAVHLVAGLSNISFRLPHRKLLNRTYAAMLLSSGVDTLICDPCDKKLRPILLAAQALLGKDDFFSTYLNEAAGS